MNIKMRWQQGLLVCSLLLALVACGGGGGDRASGVSSGPAEPGQPVTPPAPVLPSDAVPVDALDSSAALTANILDVTLNSPVAVQFAVTANGLQTVSGLTTSHVRFSLARLAPNSGTSRGEQWISYISRTEDPVCRSAADTSNSANQCTTYTTETDPLLIADSARKVQAVQATGKVVVTQANTENSGTLSANSNGSFTYVFSADIGNPATLAGVHRACIQFSLPAAVDNICIDFVPSLLADSATAPMGSSLHDDFYTTYSARQIATETTCNTCHAKLALHGGGRTQLDYCVTCHNPGTTDANSENNLDLKVLVHKIHNGRNLPLNVDDGLPYMIWGFNNSEFNFGHLSYPQPVNNCTRCHAGQADIEFANAKGLPLPEAVLTADGHNWVTNPTLAVCTACHEKLQQNLKLDGTASTHDHTAMTHATNCAGCHRDRGADSTSFLQVNMAHRDLLEEEGRQFDLVIEAVTNAGSGQQPLIDFSVRDAQGEAIDIHDPAAFCQIATFDVRIPWDGATEFLNQNADGVAASSPRMRGTKTPPDTTALGNNLFRIDAATLSTTTPIPAGIDSIAVMVDTYYPQDCDSANTDYVRLDGKVQYVATSGGAASERRGIVSVEKCGNCHARLFEFTRDPVVHGGRRGINNPEICTACHNPARSGSGDGSISHDMSVMTHAVHASAMRATPYKGTYDETALQFPGDLSRCDTCHEGDSFALPLPLTRAPVLSRSDGALYTTAIAAVCSACHDSTLAKAHMETTGGAQFDQPWVNASAVTETCAVCHGAGAAAAVDVVHNR